MHYQSFENTVYIVMWRMHYQSCQNTIYIVICTPTPLIIKWIFASFKYKEVALITYYIKMLSNEQKRSTTTENIMLTIEGTLDSI